MKVVPTWYDPKRVEVFPSREGWLRGRRIGASDFARVLEVPGAYGGPWDVWRRLVEGAPEDTRPTADQLRGQVFERFTLELYGAAHRREVKRPASHSLLRGPEAWATCSLDALADDGDAWGIVEVKTDRNAPGRWASEDCTIARWTEECATLVPPVYAIQGYAQLWMTGAPWVDLVCLTPFYELRTVRLMASPKAQEAIADEVRDWHERHVVGQVPPPLDGTPAAQRWLAEHFPPAPGNTALRTPTEAELTLIEGFVTARNDEREATGRKAMYAQRILDVIGEGRGLRVGASGKVLAVRVAGRGTLDRDALLHQHPGLADLLAEYTRTGAPSVHLRTYNLE